MRMKKFINKPERIVSELLEGFATAFQEKIILAGEGIVARAHPKSAEKVRIVTLGGSGHEPRLCSPRQATRMGSPTPARHCIEVLHWQCCE